LIEPLPFDPAEIEPGILPLVVALNSTSLFETFSSCEGHFGERGEHCDRQQADVRMYPLPGVSENAIEAFFHLVLLDFMNSPTKWDALLGIRKEYVALDEPPKPLNSYFAGAFFADLAGALAAAFFATTLFGTIFFAVAVCALAAFTNRQRFLVAAMIRFIPSALIRRLGFGGSTLAGADGSDAPLIAAHRFFCPSAIRRRAAAEILRLPGLVSVVAAASGDPPSSIWRRSAI